MLFFTRNSNAQSAGVSSWRSPSPNSTLQIDFSAHFPVAPVSCQYGNVGLQFALVEEIHNAQALNVRKEKP
jgi:hypothetical protein